MDITGKTGRISLNRHRETKDDFYLYAKSSSYPLLLNFEDISEVIEVLKSYQKAHKPFVKPTCRQSYIEIDTHMDPNHPEGFEDPGEDLYRR